MPRQDARIYSARPSASPSRSVESEDALMGLGRSAAITDPGRKRRRNEDAFVRQPPLFAVADGMGGAQAGEIASRLAAAAVRETGAAEGTPEDRVKRLFDEANRRVYTRSSEDESAAGMGTTMTVALVDDGAVTIGHVGDSRAYLIRKGALEQVTEDHSLVSELVRSGKLSPAEAESHPQRNVITRVLGTEPDVDVDTFSVRTEEGDLFLICSDGLTSMIDDRTVLEIVDRNRSDLDKALKELVRAANRKGGEDNITVVCFEITASGAAVDAGDTATQPAVEEQTLTEADAVPAIEDQPGWDGNEWQPLEAQPAPARPRRLGKRSLIVLGTIFVVLALAAAGALFALSRAHFVGAEKDGHLAVYQGIPWNLVGSLRLYRTVYVSQLRTAQLSEAERRRLFDHDLTSEATARRKLRAYESQIPGTP
jgi:protein phosphatase